MIHLGARSNASPFSRAPSPRSPRNNTALGNPRSPHGTQGKGKRKECHHCGLLLALRFTSPHGERPAPSSCIRPASPFQFTLPHGERRVAEVGEDALHGFNSRSRMGSDRFTSHLKESPGSFNSRSRMGSDHRASPRWAPRTRFNSRSRMGSDRMAPILSRFDNVSIHAPAWGATRSISNHHQH